MTAHVQSTASLVDTLGEEMIETRRRLHRLPELGFQEVDTAALIAARLRAIEGVDEIHEGVGRTGVTALIRGARPGPVLLLRADIDALPIREATGAPYASTRDGAMHACGHDGHTAILLSVARVLAARRDRFGGTAFLVFQPAEEILTGAQAMLNDGVWDLAGGPIAAALGLHLSNWLPLGTVGVRSGPFFAAVDRFTVTITGKGGHGAHPDQAIDPIVTAAETILSLQRVVSREVPPLKPAVLSVCQVQSGTAFNIIPEEAHLVGTVRSFEAEVRRDVAESMERIVAGVAAASGARHRLEIEAGPPAVVNDAAMCDLVRRVAAPVVGQDQVIEAEPTMGGDDVALFLQRVPGCYFLVGSSDPSRGLDAAHHHPRFDFAEEALTTAATVFADAALSYLS
ncbi:MAG TPA: amidohydrolase [Chloroflexota bacterium]|nr:amidohydrolase [Chloroflexota bacterium]